MQLDFVHSEQARISSDMEQREHEIEELKSEKQELELMFSAHGEAAPDRLSPKLDVCRIDYNPN